MKKHTWESADNFQVIDEKSLSDDELRKAIAQRKETQWLVESGALDHIYEGGDGEEHKADFLKNNKKGLDEAEKELARRGLN